MIARLLVTGGCGFIGSNFIRHALKAFPRTAVVNLDALTYAGNPENLAGLDAGPRYRFVRGDIADGRAVAQALRGGVEAVVHFAAESHVDRSLYEPAAFVRTNVGGTQVLLEGARKAGVRRFVHVSTDEVYGSLGARGRFREDSPLRPSSPYSASKAASDLLALAYHRTFGFPVIVTRASNNYGPYQFPEKLVPLFIANAFENRRLPVYGDGRQVRDWLHVADHCRALAAALLRGRPGEVYNIGADCERTNLQVTRAILRAAGKTDALIEYVQDRPGHDRRYALDSSKARRELGWRPRMGFAAGLAGTVEWYRRHREWCDRVRSGAYRAHYERHYRRRFEADRSAAR